MTQSTKEIYKFIVVGCINTSISFVLYMALLLIMPYRTAYIVSYAGGVVTSYLLNGKWTFSSKVTLHGLLSYPLVYLIPLSIGWAVLEFSMKILGYSEIISYILSLVFSVPVGFISAKYFFNRSV
jgi:putative flippase GtrA